jgi:integrase/recombinase XerC
MSTPKTLTENECTILLDALRNADGTPAQARKGVRNYLIGCLLLEAGLRVGEVVALELSHLYFNGKPVQTLVLTGDMTKNKIERTVPISSRLKAALQSHWEYHPWLNCIESNTSVWQLARNPKPITTRQTRRIIHKAAIRSIGRPVHPHMLRHTFATKLMRVTDMKTVSELLGHSNMTSTQIYCHSNEDDKKKAIEKMDRSNGQ